MLTLLSCSAVEHCCPAGLVPSKVVPMEGPLSLVCIEPHIILLSTIWDGRTELLSTVSFRKSVMRFKAATARGGVN